MSVGGEGSVSSSGRLPTPRGFSPPRWIVSAQDHDLLNDAIVAQAGSAAATGDAARPPPHRRAHQGGVGSRWHEKDDDHFTPYGPRTRRRGPMLFVKAKAAEIGSETTAIKTEGALLEGKDKGAAIKSMYEELVGLRKKSEESSPPPPAQPVEGVIVDVDLTGEDSDSDDADDDNVNEDDVVIIEDDSGLPAQRRPTIKSRQQQLGIHHLLPSDLTTPRDIPIQYGVKGVGYQMIKRLGWIEGQPLGKTDPSQKRLKVPLKASDKFDRTGLGVVNKDGKKRSGQTRQQLEADRKRLALLERDKRGRGSAGIAKQKAKEKRERAALMYYMNH